MVSIVTWIARTPRSLSLSAAAGRAWPKLTKLKLVVVVSLSSPSATLQATRRDVRATMSNDSDGTVQL